MYENLVSIKRVKRPILKLNMEKLA